MKSGEALAAKIIDIDRQYTPTARLCSPRAIRSKKSEAWFHELKKCIRFISKLSSYLGFRWLTPSPLNIDPRNNSMENMIHFISLYLEVLQDFQKQEACSHLFQPTLSLSFCVWTSLRSLEKTTPTFRKAFVWLKVGIKLHIFLIYFARSKILSLRDHVTFRTWSCACVCEGWMSFWVVFDFGFSILPLGSFFFSRVRL